MPPLRAKALDPALGLRRHHLPGWSRQEKGCGKEESGSFPDWSQSQAVHILRAAPRHAGLLLAEEVWVRALKFACSSRISDKQGSSRVQREPVVGS